MARRHHYFVVQQQDIIETDIRIRMSTWIAHVVFSFYVIAENNTTVVVDWGDGTIEEIDVIANIERLIYHDFAVKGDFLICINEVNSYIKEIGFSSTTANRKGIVSVEKIAGSGIVNLAGAFSDCNYLTATCDFSETTNVLNVSGIYLNCTALTGLATPIINSAPQSLVITHNAFLNCTGLSDYAQIPAAWK